MVCDLTAVSDTYEIVADWAPTDCLYVAMTSVVISYYLGTICRCYHNAGLIMTNCLLICEDILIDREVSGYHSVSQLVHICVCDTSAQTEPEPTLLCERKGTT